MESQEFATVRLCCEKASSVMSNVANHFLGLCIFAFDVESCLVAGT